MIASSLKSKLKSKISLPTIFATDRSLKPLQCFELGFANLPDQAGVRKLGEGGPGRDGGPENRLRGRHAQDGAMPYVRLAGEKKESSDVNYFIVGQIEHQKPYINFIDSFLF